MAFIDPNDFEAVALDTASEMGGAYIGSEGMNLVIPNEWKPEQWKTLVETICAAYVGNLQDQNAQSLAALQKVTHQPPIIAAENKRLAADYNGPIPF